MNKNDVSEQQIALDDEEYTLLKLDTPIESYIRSKYDIPYHKLPYCYGRVYIGEVDTPFAGAHLFLFRDKPLTDSRRRAWKPSPSTEMRL